MLTDIERADSYIVFEGIFRSDLSDDTEDEKSRPKKEHESKNMIFSSSNMICFSTDKIPTNYNGYDDWLKKTKNFNILCWYCGNSFSTPPYFVPRNAEPTKHGTCMGIEGWFSTINCAWSYVNMVYHDKRERDKRYELLQLLYKEMSGANRLCNIAQAPDRYNQVQYGRGDMTNEEFHAECNKAQLAAEQS